MTAQHLRQALDHVRQIRGHIIDRQRFTGYSGRARMVAGSVALLGALAIGSGRVPDTDLARLRVWGTVFVLSVVVNYGALIYWFLHDPRVDRDVRRLRPALDVLPPLAAGGILTLAFVLRHWMDMLYGTWMLLYGLANLASRRVLPRPITFVGGFYLICGTACLLASSARFDNPWPMGTVFFVGELVGGAILHVDRTRHI